MTATEFELVEEARRSTAVPGPGGLALQGALTSYLALGGGLQLHAEHLADLRRSNLTDETIVKHQIFTVSPGDIPRLLGFDPKPVQSAYLIGPPGFPADFFRLKIFPSYTDREGNRVKYLQPRASGVRLFVPVQDRTRLVDSTRPLWLCEGEKKSLCAAQLGLAAVAILGVEGWHPAGRRELLQDFDGIPLADRVIELAIDGDIWANPNVNRAARQFADALRHRGARPRLVVFPEVAP